MDIGFWGTIVGAILGSSVISVLITSLFNNKKVKAEANHTAVDGAVKWAESMRKDIDDMREEVKLLRVEYQAIQRENSALKAEVTQLRIEVKLYKAGKPELVDAIGSSFV